MRGVVVSKLVNVTRYGMTMQSELDPDNVRMWLLHWDKLEYPIGGFDRSTAPDEQFLIDSGVMQRTLADPMYLTSDQAVPQNGGLFNSTIDTYNLLETQQPGVWSIARTKLPASPWDGLETPRTFEQDDTARGIYIRLIAAVPVPTKEVPLADILRLKDRRKSEMLAFRSHVEKLYQDVLNAPDRPLAELQATEALQRGARDVVASEPKFSWTWCDLSGKFNLLNAGAAAFTAHTAGLGLLSTLLAGAAGAAVEIGPSFALSKQKRSSNPFEYIAGYQRELG